MFAVVDIKHLYYIVFMNEIQNSYEHT